MFDRKTIKGKGCKALVTTFLICAFTACESDDKQPPTSNPKREIHNQSEIIPSPPISTYDGLYQLASVHECGVARELQHPSGFAQLLKISGEKGSFTSAGNHETLKRLQGCSVIVSLQIHYFSNAENIAFDLHSKSPKLHPYCGEEHSNLSEIIEYEKNYVLGLLGRGSFQIDLNSSLPQLTLRRENVDCPNTSRGDLILTFNRYQATELTNLVSNVGATMLDFEHEEDEYQSGSTLLRRTYHTDRYPRRRSPGRSRQQGRF